MKINKKILFLLAISIVLLAPLNSVMAACGSNSGNAKLDGILTKIKDLASGIGAGIAVIGFIVAGILYLMSGGAPEKMQGAKRAIIAAVIGAALVGLAQAANIMTDIVCTVFQ